MLTGSHFYPVFAFGSAVYRLNLTVYPLAMRLRKITAINDTELYACSLSGKQTMTKGNAHKRQYGFTIMELMIVIAIAGILAMLAVPNFGVMIKNNCLITKTNSMVSSLQFARSEAVKRNSSVSLSALNGGDASNEWGTGWNIVDDSTAATIRVVQLQQCSTTTADETSTAPSVTAISYAGDGFLTDGGTIDICDDRTGETGRRITISATGRPGVSEIVCL